jgi:DNA-binding MarR family transcriptional regulator
MKKTTRKTKPESTKAARPTQPARDHIDAMRSAWNRELPELDTEPLDVLGRINRIAHLTSRPIERVFASCGLERGEFDALASLCRAGEPYELTPTQLYQQLLISSGGLTHRLNRLEQAGLITREASSDDARSRIVRLTRLGRKRVLDAYARDMRLESELLADLSAEEREELSRLLRRLHLSIEERLKRLDPP